MAWLETLTGSLVSAVLQVLFDRMFSPHFWDFLREREFDESLLRKLKLKLLAVNAVLSDAEEKQFSNPSVKDWMDELKDAAYDAEDVLDDITTELQLLKLETMSGTRTAQVQDLESRLITKIKSKIINIIKRFEAIAEEKDLLNLKEGSGGRPMSPRMPTTSLVDESEVVGRGTNQNEIVEFLLKVNADENQVPLLVAIVGMPGIGKTTLAQLVFNDARVKRSFGLRAWAHVSEEFDAVKVTKTIYESVAPCDSNTTDLNILQVGLQARLMGKKFLLVLDDVWNENFHNWDVLQRPFRAGAPGSRIIVTTRSSNVGLIMRAAHSHLLLPLSDKDCFLLFEKNAFRNGISEVDPIFYEIGEKIANKCKGLPLAAKSLGALLFSTTGIQEWLSVLNSKLWDLPSDKSSIFPALRLSYFYLPSHLKRCFAYCSVFPKGYKVKKEDLVLLWMAEGLVLQTGSKKRSEVLGEEYFNELLSRSFFQPDRNDNSSFQMHDLFIDLAHSIAGEFCVKFEDGNSQDVTERVRYFSYLADKYNISEKHNDYWCATRLRTFLPLHLPSSRSAYTMSPLVLCDLLQTFSYLRVLSLSPYRHQICTVPASIGKLKHLRHLNLSSTNIQIFPEFESSLYNLETLLLSQCRRLSTLPTDLKNLISLHYFDLSGTAIQELPESICSLTTLETLLLYKCSRLVKLPKDMHKLFNLQHLDILGTNLEYIPAQFGLLKNLQVLTAFVVGSDAPGIAFSRIGELRELCNLQGTLSILELQNVGATPDASDAKLEDKKYLHELLFQWGAHPNNPNDQAILACLRPHVNLKKLTVTNYGGAAFPVWLGDASYTRLVSLHLKSCEQCSSLPVLGHLSYLKELHVKSMTGVILVAPEFLAIKSLVTLKFEDMLNWESWESSLDRCELPSLQNLSIKGCPKLTGNLPKHLPSLKSLLIDECRLLKFQDEDMEHHYMEMQTLEIKRSCEPLQTLSYGCFPKLSKLALHDCENLKFLTPEEPHEDLRENIEIRQCPNLVWSGSSGLPTTNSA